MLRCEGQTGREEAGRKDGWRRGRVIEGWKDGEMEGLIDGERRESRQRARGKKLWQFLEEEPLFS